MNYTEKQLALLEHITDQHNATDITRIPNNYYEQIKTLLEYSIAQAVAEERERVERKIKQAWNYPCNCDRKNILCIHDFSQMKLALSFLINK